MSEVNAVKEGQRKMRNRDWKQTWIWNWLINNKFIALLFVLLLIFLNILLFIRLSPLFAPIGITLEIIGPPIVFSGILYYLISPMVAWLEKKNFSRQSATVLLLSLLILFVVLGIAIVLPIIRDQIVTFVTEWPVYWENIVTQLDDLLNTEIFSELMVQINETDLVSVLSDQGTTIIDATVGRIGSFIGIVAQFFITLFTFPVILYYLLKDGDNLPDYVFQFVPITIRAKLKQVFSEMNSQLSSYIRGQLLVALSVGIMFWLGFAIVGLDYAVTLGVLAGVLNLIPYLGSIVATVPALVIALVDSPFMLLKVLVVFGVEQVIEGRIISPQILGSNLKIHPVTILFILLVAGRLFGVTGLILGVPGYAILKIIAAHVFLWYRDVSGLYEEGVLKSDPSKALVEESDENRILK